YRDVELSVTGILYAHLEGSRNHARCLVTVRRGQEQAQIALEREWPGRPASTHALGLEIALDDVEAYGQPGQAILLIRAAR
ncbi:MAG: hypothetical protein IT378_11860, partial [Sandaracinaceae bacterium]|nr:hypothetical protein [Sandaracinaceae bacterium]